MEYVYSLLAFIAISAILGLSFDLLFGQAGLPSIAHAAFYGIGSYAAALAMLRLGVPFVVALAVAMLVTAAVAAAVAVPALRLADDYLVVASFGFQAIVTTIMLNWRDVTRGSMGLPGIPRPELFGIRLTSQPELLVLIYAVAAICAMATWRLIHSPYGRVLRSIRDDEIAVAACGKNVTSFRVSVFAVSGALAAAAGALYATYITFIDPESFLLAESFFILIIAVIGGSGTFWGPILGAVFVWLMPEALRFMSLPNEVLGPARQLLYGALLIAFVVLRPQGLAGAWRR